MKSATPARRASLDIRGRYTRFSFGNWTLTFLHGKDLLQYLAVKSWDSGLLVVDCLGRLKGRYEDYIDLSHLLGELHMDPAASLAGLSGVDIAHAS